MNLTDRVYLTVHLVLTVLVCVRHQRVEHGPSYVAWNLIAIALIALLARKRRDGSGWEFAHDWLPAVFFVTVFEEVSYPVALDSRRMAKCAPDRGLSRWCSRFHRWSGCRNVPHHGWWSSWSSGTWPSIRCIRWWADCSGRGESGLSFAGAFRRLTDALTIGYVLCYGTYLLFPTQSPANRLGVQQIASAHGGPFHAMVQLIQNHGGVHGNAFPSAHIMLAFVVLVFALSVLAKRRALAAGADTAHVRWGGVRRLPLLQRRRGRSNDWGFRRSGVLAAQT